MSRMEGRGARSLYIVGAALVATWILSGLLQMPSRPDDGYSADPEGRVSRVEVGGPAEAAGLQVGDNITAIGGVPASELPAAPRRVYPHIGESQTLEVERGGSVHTLELI